MLRQSRDFLVTLPSNTSLDIHKANRPSNYTVQLQNYVELDGDWEVAATEIQFSRAWINIDNDYDIGVFIALRTAENPEAETYEDVDEALNAWRVTTWGTSTQAKFKYYKIVIQRGYYPTYRELAAEICHLIKSRAAQDFGGFDVKYTYDDSSRVARIEPVHPFIIRITALREDLLSMIGIKKTPTGYQKENFAFYGMHQINLEKYNEPEGRIARIENSIIAIDTTPDGVPEKQAVFAYCDVIDHQFVGNVKAQILGVIPVNNEGDALTHWTFNPPYYSRVIAQSFNSVHVWLADHLGEEINFVDTTDFIVLRLHFRPVPKRL